MLDPALIDFYLVGDTGLALQLKHRKSVDIATSSVIKASIVKAFAPIWSSNIKHIT
jgi:hypothetical protein